MTDLWAVDADGHVLDNREIITEHLPPQFRRREWAWVPRNTWDSTLGGKLGLRQIEVKEWLETMDLGRVETVVLFPTRLLNIGFVQEPELAVALCQAYNGYVQDEYLRVSPRFRAVTVLPMQDIPAAVQELHRCVQELGMVGGMVPAYGPALRPPLGHPMFYPLYEEAQRLACPLAIHSNVTYPSGPEVDPFARFIQAHTIVHPFGQMRQLTSIIFEGVLERFPRLTIACMESGATWVPYFADRLDEEYEKRGADEAPKVPGPPSRYFRAGRIYVHFEPGEGLLPQTLQYIGDDFFVYASDYPHWDHEFPESLEKMRRHTGLTEGQKQKVLRDNARRLFRLS